MPTEELKALGSVDIMRGEFWNGKTEQLTPDGFEELQIVKPIASAAHIYGHRVVEMEAFTSHINWQEGPDVFKPLADRAFCEGHDARRLPHDGAQPSRSGSARLDLPGRFAHEHQPHLVELSEPLHAYFARCSALLMQGDFVADVAWYYGDEVPNFAKPKHLRPGLGYGYDYDDLNTEVLLRAGVDGEGKILLPSGMRYAVLVLPDDNHRMSLAVLAEARGVVEDRRDDPRQQAGANLRTAGISRGTGAACELSPTGCGERRRPRA